MRDPRAGAALCALRLPDRRARRRTGRDDLLLRTLRQGVRRRQGARSRVVDMEGRVIWTIGHSTHALETFIAMLCAHRVTTVTDVRRFPVSRRHPHYNGAALQASLTQH